MKGTDSDKRSSLLRHELITAVTSIHNSVQGVMTFFIMTLSIMDLIVTLSINGMQHKDTNCKHFRVIMLSYCYAKCHYDECRYAMPVVHLTQALSMCMLQPLWLQGKNSL